MSLRSTDEHDHLGRNCRIVLPDLNGVMSTWMSAVSTFPVPPTQPRNGDGSLSKEVKYSLFPATRSTMNSRISHFRANRMRSPDRTSTSQVRSSHARRLRPFAARVGFDDGFDDGFAGVDVTGTDGVAEGVLDVASEGITDSVTDGESSTDGLPESLPQLAITGTRRQPARTRDALMRLTVGNREDGTAGSTASGHAAYVLMPYADSGARRVENVLSARGVSVADAMTRTTQPITFLHSADWQLGMVRRFLGPDGQARFAQARLDAVAEIGAIAARTGARFVVVAGDVFEHNQVERQTILRAAEALKRIEVPVLLVPGNHDALEPGSLWNSPQWQAHVPEHVRVLTDSAPYEVVPGVEVVAAPWRSRRPLTDPVASAYADLPPTDGHRVLVGHGQFDELNGGLTDVPPIDVAGLERAIATGRLHYVALGDRHSTTQVRDRIWYSGSQEVTSTEETDAGHVLAVTLTDDGCEVTKHRTGHWHMIEHRALIDCEEALHRLDDWFAELQDKERTYIRLCLTGELTLPLLSRLDATVDAQGEVFASVERCAKHWAVRPAPDDADFDDLALSGPARAALDELRQAVAAGDDDAAAALALMHRLALESG